MEDFMYKNIGSKIKTVVQVITWIGIIVSVGVGLYMIYLGVEYEDATPMLIGIITMAVGSLCSWLMGFLTYGFGQLVENTDILVEVLAPDYRKNKEKPAMIKSLSETEQREIMESYLDSDWNRSIKYLSDDELQKRMNSDEWQVEYQVLCKKEYDRRHGR